MRTFRDRPLQGQEHKGKEAREHGTVHQQEKYSAKIAYQDMHIQYGGSNGHPGGVIQCFPEESRTLSHEADEIREQIQKLYDEVGVYELSGEHDDDYVELYEPRKRLVWVHETLHHILPRRMIKNFIQKLSLEEKKNILLTFLRYTEGGENDVTKEELDRIMKVGTPEEKDVEGRKLINGMLDRTLKSLRSNLTFGPTKRSDDPQGKAYDLDPNYTPGGKGELDAISICYREAYEKIVALQRFPDGTGQSAERGELIAEIVEKLKEAESLLAQKQGITGADAYRRTRLMRGEVERWVLGFGGKNPYKVRG